MSYEIFKQQIEREIRQLDDHEIKRLAFKSSIYSLPFLGVQGNLTFWNDTEQQKYLYSIFQTLDIVASIIQNNQSYNFQIANSVATAAYAINNSAKTPYYSVNAVANVASAVVASSKTALIKAAGSAAASSAYASITANSKINLKQIIIDEIKSINRGEKRRQVKIENYGYNWDSFQYMLQQEDCSFWYNVYQQVFENDFLMNDDELQLRLNVPSEIKSRGASSVASYLEKMEEQGSTNLNEARIIILGEKGAGKTCLARRLIKIDAPMTTPEESTAGVDTTIWKLKEENIKIRIWDFAGHTVTHAVHQFFLSERCLYIFVYDGRSEERNRLEYWLNHMKNYGGDSEAIILINKRDENAVDLPINSLKEKYHIKDVYTVDIDSEKSKLRSIRKDIIKFIKNNPSWQNQKIPINYFKVKEVLEDLFFNNTESNESEYIERKKFDAIALSHEVENPEELLQDLHHLGISLWYKELKEFDTLVLNPEWLSHGVYKIINWMSNNDTFSISRKDFRIVFQESRMRYPEDKYNFLFDLIIHYELGYQVDNSDLIIPHLLKEDRPEELVDFPVQESLMLRYKAETPLPPNTITRFIVKHNKEIFERNGKPVVWRFGVILQNGNDSIAMVREEDRLITVFVKGKQKTLYLSVLRDTLNTIFKSYRSEKPELQYKIYSLEETIEEPIEEPELWLPDTKILNHYNRRRSYYDDITDQEIPMAPIVVNYNIGENAILGGTGHQFVVSNSVKNLFNIKDSNIGLQGSINELSRLLIEENLTEEAQYLTNTASFLEDFEEIEEKKELKKAGITNRIKKIIEEFNDENSKLHKSVKKIKNGVSIAQDIGKGYNEIAQWCGLPQVPTPFLKKE